MPNAVAKYPKVTAAIKFIDPFMFLHFTAGAVDEDTFKEAMEKGLPKVHLYSQRDFDDTMTKIHNVISDEKKDWEERAKAVRFCILK